MNRSSVVQIRNLVVVFCGLIIPAALPGCSVEDETPSIDEPIIQGTATTEFPEAALIQMGSHICSGSIIAPRVALTAGHCVTGHSSWTIQVPSIKRSVTSSRAITSYTSTGDKVAADQLDVAILILDTPVVLPWYVPITNAAASNGTIATTVGRVHNGEISSQGFFVGRPVTLLDATYKGFPFAYSTDSVVEPGDSGGPAYIGTGTTRSIVAVTSGRSDRYDFLARVDFMGEAISQAIAQNGGQGRLLGEGLGGQEDSNGCQAEREPNNWSFGADGLRRCRIGALQGADHDWFSWENLESASPSEVSLHSNGDAELLVWASTGTSFTRVVAPFIAQSNYGGSGKTTYIAAIYSPHQQTQNYILRRSPASNSVAQ
jgi:hypothetical protein